MNDREEILKKVIHDTLWMAIRYAHGRHTYAPSMVRDAVKALKELYPDFQLREDNTIKPPQKEEIDDMCLREDWLDDLFEEE